LISALGFPSFLAAYKDFPEVIQRRINDRHRMVTPALAKMVVSPPDVTGSPDSKTEWIDCWNKN
jgi:hypothetical protein